MMIHFIDAVATDAAVMCSIGFHNLTFFTKTYLADIGPCLDWQLLAADDIVQNF